MSIKPTIPDNPEIEVIKAGKTGLFTNYIFKAIPLAFDESMSYYETLCGLLHYLQNTIMPTVNNNANAVAELQTLYEELRTFVDDYFTNLDVQEEINNKLDALVEDGTLTRLIGNYVQPLIDEQNENIANFENTINDEMSVLNARMNENIANFENTINDEMSVLNARMNEFTNLPEGSTTGDAELQDIRVGFNGITYQNAGDSVRNQANQVNQYKSSLLTSLFNKKDITWQNNKRINNNGVLVDADGWQTSNPIPINSKYLLFDYKYRFGSSLTFTYLFNFYENNDIIARNNLGRINPTNAEINTVCYGNLMKLDIPKGTNYLCISCITNDIQSINVYDTSLNIDLINNNSIDYNKLKDLFYYENILTGISSGGTIAQDGTINTSTTYKITDFIECEPNTIYYRKNSNDIALVGCYDIDKNWIKRTGSENNNFFKTPENCKYIRYCDSNNGMINQVVGRYYVDKFISYNIPKMLYIDESEFTKEILKKFPKNKLYNKNVCVLGDSIAYGVGASDRNTKSWVALLQNNTGANITNLAISGASLQYRSGAESQAKSVYTISTETDFTPYDYVIISAGTNDILANIGNPDDTINTTACGALNLIIQNILTSNPYCQIIFFGPMFRNRFSQGDGHNSDDYDYNGKWVIDLADKLQETAEKNHIPNKNLYRTFELNKYNANILLSDGLHPNDLGYERLYKVIDDFININI